MVKPFIPVRSIIFFTGFEHEAGAFRGLGDRKVV